MRELSSEERQIGIFKNKFRESGNPEIQMMILDALSTYNDKGLEAIAELMRMTNIEEVKAHGTRLINGFGDKKSL
jgi:hypothetical protein